MHVLYFFFLLISDLYTYKTRSTFPFIFLFIAFKCSYICYFIFDFVCLLPYGYLSIQMSVSRTVFEHSYVRLLIYYILYDDLTFVCWYQTFLLPTYFIGKNHCIKSFAVFKPIAVFFKKTSYVYNKNRFKVCFSIFWSLQ